MKTSAKHFKIALYDILKFGFLIRIKNKSFNFAIFISHVPAKHCHDNIENSDVISFLGTNNYSYVNGGIVFKCFHKCFIEIHYSKIIKR